MCRLKTEPPRFKLVDCRKRGANLNWTLVSLRIWVGRMDFNQRYNWTYFRNVFNLANSVDHRCNWILAVQGRTIYIRIPRINACTYLCESCLSLDIYILKSYRIDFDAIHAGYGPKYNVYAIYWNVEVAGFLFLFFEWVVAEWKRRWISNCRYVVFEISSQFQSFWSLSTHSFTLLISSFHSRLWSYEDGQYKLKGGLQTFFT